MEVIIINPTPPPVSIDITDLTVSEALVVWNSLMGLLHTKKIGTEERRQIDHMQYKLWERLESVRAFG